MGLPQRGPTLPLLKEITELSKEKTKQVTQIHFKHIHGSDKDIPGVKHEDLRPRLVKGRRMSEQLNRWVDVWVTDENHVVRVTLLPEDPDVELGPGADKLPTKIKEKLQEAKAEEFLARVRANERVRASIYSYAENGALEVLHDGPVEEQEAKKLAALTIDMSEIAINDHIERGIPLPDHIKKTLANRKSVRSKQTSESIPDGKGKDPKPTDGDNEPKTDE
jgi:hypothetical protein